MGNEQGDSGNRVVAVVGCGYWGGNYVRLLSEMPGVGEVIAIDSDIRRLAEMAGRFPRVTVAESVSEVVGRIDGAVVSTPAATHYAVAKPLIEAGIHVLIEKPITTISEEAYELGLAASEHGVVLAVGHTFLHHDGIKALKHYVDEPAFGTPYYMYSQRTNLGPIRRDVDALWDLAPHDIAIFNRLIGADPVVVSAVGHRALQTQRFDSGFVTMTYPGEVIANIHVSWADPAKVRQVVVVGSGRRVVFDDLNPNERIRVFEKGVAPMLDVTDSFGEHQLQIRDGDILSPRIGTSEPLRNQMLDFFEAMDTGKAPLCGVEDGLGVVKVMEAIERSVALRGTPVLVEGRGVYHRGDDILVDLGLSGVEPVRAVAS